MVDTQYIICLLYTSCAAQFLAEHAKAGIFNTHAGFDKKFLENAHNFLMANLANEENQA